MKKSILILYTGGTIGMAKTLTGYQPTAGLLAKLMAEDRVFNHADMPHYDIMEYTPLIDSSNMTPQHWNTLAKDIVKAYEQYDGFVILHGTDTMAYTACALSFMIEGLNKPVILTGAQVALVEAHSDARENLISALLLASRYCFPEVTILFNHHLLRGNRAHKIDSVGYNAFVSPNYAPLAEVGSDLVAHTALFCAADSRPLTIHKYHPIAMTHFHFFPGFSLNTLETLLDMPLKALLLQTYGSGNVPTIDKKLFLLLEKAIARGLVVANSSQCLKGQVNMASYATGQALQQIGVISAQDMTPEAATVKLQFLCSVSTDATWIRQQYALNLRGELTRAC
ncbi:MAG: asparaginase [Gammaproteobacteria bacterium]|nr:asparaginase [Gammaproteobacteria bacterium]